MDPRGRQCCLDAEISAAYQEGPNKNVNGQKK
jgi:hypothetical protein